jgi:hypothetical protein
MRAPLTLHAVALLGTALCATTSAAADPAGEKATPGKDGKISLRVQVLSGEPPTPIRNAEVSVKGPDGGDVADAKRSDKNGDVLFLDLPRVDMVIVIVAKDHKTFKAVRTVDQPQDPLTAVLERLDR